MCCTPGHAQRNLGTQLWTIGYAGCFGVWVWKGDLSGRGSDLGGLLAPFLYLACIEWCSHTSTSGGACTDVGEALNGLAFAGSFPVAYGCSVHSHACHIGMCETSWGQCTLTDTLSMFA